MSVRLAVAVATRATFAAPGSHNEFTIPAAAEPAGARGTTATDPMRTAPVPRTQQLFQAIHFSSTAIAHRRPSLVGRCSAA